MFILYYLGFVLSLLATTSALLEETFIAFNSSSGALPLSNATILYAADDFGGIQVAVNSLVDDLDEILGSRLAHAQVTPQNLSQALEGVRSNLAIIVGSLSQSFLVQDLAAEGKVDAANIQGKWETFQTAVVTDPFPGLSNALVIAGSDMRGAMYGVYTLCEQAGQSPFWYWTDTPAQKHDEIYVLPKQTLHGPPSIKYRGLFINDEAPSLTTWWSQRNDKKHHPLDSAFYTHVFDMLLRLKANFMWPAMWVRTTPVYSPHLPKPQPQYHLKERGEC